MWIAVVNCNVAKWATPEISSLLWIYSDSVHVAATRLSNIDIECSQCDFCFHKLLNVLKREMRRERRTEHERPTSGERVLPLGVRVRHMGMVGSMMGRQRRGTWLLVWASGEHRARARARHKMRARRGGGGRVCMRYEVRVLRVRGRRVLRARWQRWRWRRMGPRGRAARWPATGPGTRITGVQRATVRRAVHQLPYFLLVVGDVVRQLGLLEASGWHPLVARWARWRRIRTVKTGLDQRLAGIARDHRLQFTRRERVYVASLARH